MKTLNRVTLLGHLGKDPELKYTSSGTPVARLQIATSERFKDKDSQWKDRPEWHNVIAWSKLAEIAGEHLKKGAKVYVEGRLETRSWDKDGEKRYTTSVVASELIFFSERGSSSTPAARPNAHGVTVSDDDIPF